MNPHLPERTGLKRPCQSLSRNLRSRLSVTSVLATATLLQSWVSSIAYVSSETGAILTQGYSIRSSELCISGSVMEWTLVTLLQPESLIRGHSQRYDGGQHVLMMLWSEVRLHADCVYCGCRSHNWKYIPQFHFI